jgi:hypothetical protein
MSKDYIDSAGHDLVEGLAHIVGMPSGTTMAECEDCGREVMAFECYYKLSSCQLWSGTHCGCVDNE